MELKEIPTGQMDGLNLHGMRTEFTHLNQTIIMFMSIPRLVRQPELKSTLKFGYLQNAGLVIKWLRIIRMWVGITWTSKRMKSRNIQRMVLRE